MLQIREAVRVGMPLEDALDKHAEWGRHHVPDGESRTVDPEAAKRARARQNDASLRALQGMMGGVK